MKKFLLLLLTVCGVWACTTPQEDAQIKLFWFEQIMQIMPRPAGPARLSPQPFPVPADEETAPQEPALPTQEDATQPPISDSSAPQDVTTEGPSGSQPPAEADSQATQDGATTPGAQAPQPAAAPKPKKPLPGEEQFIEITLEDSPTAQQPKSNAPLKERQAMQLAVKRVKQSNQQAVQDIGSLFGEEAQAQASAIVFKSEKMLQNSVNTSNTYQNYLKAQQKILQEQEQQLNQLMRANAYKLSRTRG